MKNSVQPETKSVRASLQFLAMFLAIVLVFGLGGSLILAAFDKVETHSAAPLLNPGVLFGGALHFIQRLFQVAFTDSNPFGVPYRNFFLVGLATTIEYCFISMPLAIVLGFLLSQMHGSRLWIVRAPARALVEFIRNTPLLVQMLVIYYGLIFLPQWLDNPFTAGIATLTINYCAYESENLRAGLGAIDRGQTEAAVALGLGRWQTLRLIIVPQMIPISLPTVINDFIYMFKDSSILSLIFVVELTAQSQALVRHFPFNTWQFYGLAAILYLVLSLPLGRLARYLEARLRSRTFAQGRDLTSLTGIVLLSSIAVGLVAGLLAGETMWARYGMPLQALDSVLFTLTLLLAVMVALGLPVYVIGLLVPWIRRPRVAKPRAPGGSALPPSIAIKG
ncbi:MAG TPA: amino acid ABC transporter permease [Ktedonobacterales bacterium]